MAGKVLSVEVGSYLTKICEIDYKTKKAKLYNYFIIETPRGTLEDGILTVNEVFVNYIKKELGERKISTKKIAFTISSSKIASREVLIPFVKENRIMDLIRTNAANYFPIDITKYQFTHNIVRIETDDKGIKQYRVMVLAIPNILIDGYKNLANALGMEVAAIDYIGNSIFQAVKTECTEGSNMIIKVDEFSALMMVIKDSTIIFSRTIPYGISDAVTSIMNSEAWGENLTYLEAVDIARKNSVLCLKSNLKTEEQTIGGVEDEKLRIAKQSVSTALSALIGGISRVIDYYQSSPGAEPIERFILTGIGGDLTELIKFLTQEMGIKIEALTKLESISAEKPFFDENFGEYIGCIGAAIEPITFYSNADTDTKKGKKLKEADQLTICISVLVLCIGISAALIIISFIPYYSAIKEQNTLTQRQEELLPVKDIYQTYLNSKASYEKLSTWDSSTYNSNDNIVTFIEELEQKMPSTFSVQSITAESGKATLEATVDSKDAAALVIAQLRNFENVASVSTDTITEVQSDTGETQVVLSIDVAFNITENTGE